MADDCSSQGSMETDLEMDQEVEYLSHEADGHVVPPHPREAAPSDLQRLAHESDRWTMDERLSLASDPASHVATGGSDAAEPKLPVADALGAVYLLARPSLPTGFFNLFS